jgi:general secretion pathway protein A
MPEFRVGPIQAGWLPLREGPLFNVNIRRAWARVWRRSGWCRSAAGYPPRMYVPFFGLSREPFSIAPDPRFLFMSERHREALAHLLYGVRGGGGFVLLTGEIGAGKTTVGRCFLEQLPGHCAVAYIFNPKLSVVELLQTVCAEFGLPVAPGEASIKSHVDALNRFLLEAHAQGRQALLVIDEAQSLSAEVLEQLRLLTNLETAERKLLQIILIGQPELRDMLAQPGLEQLAQRVIARYHLGPLSREESAQYVAHRLAVAGPDGRTGGAALFDPAALSALHRLAAGVPRRINLLADRALLGAYAQGRRRVDRRTVVRAAAEVFADTRRTRASAGPAWPAAAWWAVALLGLCLVMLGTWAFQQRLLVGQGGWVSRALRRARHRYPPVPRRRRWQRPRRRPKGPPACRWRAACRSWRLQPLWPLRPLGLRLRSCLASVAAFGPGRAGGRAGLGACG